MKGAAGAEISWKCVGTSANNNMVAAKYRTTEFTGKTSVQKGTTKAAPATNTSASVSADSALMSSLFAAIIMIVAVFFY